MREGRRMEKREPFFEGEGGLADVLREKGDVIYFCGGGGGARCEVKGEGETYSEGIYDDYLERREVGGGKNKGCCRKGAWPEYYEHPSVGGVKWMSKLIFLRSD